MFGAGGYAVAAGFDPNLHGTEAEPDQLFSRGSGCQNLVEGGRTYGYAVGHAGQKGRSQLAFEDQAVSVKRTCEASASLDASSTEWDNLNPHFCRTRIEATLCFATPA